jgi:hypothetical protein
METQAVAEAVLESARTERWVAPEELLRESAADAEA